MKKKFYDLERDGVTQGLLIKYMSCRKIAKTFIEGWRSQYTYSAGLNFGSIIHGVIEKVYLDIQSKKLKRPPSTKQLAKHISTIEKEWHKENPSPSKDLIETAETSFAIAEKTLPVYLDFWKTDDYKKFKWLEVEKSFSHRMQVGKYSVPIRGKRDGDIHDGNGHRLFETKTSSMINEMNLMDTLWYEFQTNVYMWAMRQEYKKYPKGCIYNIIRRSGLRRGKTETLKQLADRIAKDIEKRQEFYFMRYQIDVLKSDQMRFEKQLKAIMEDFVEWYHDQENYTYRNTSQCITKYGRCGYVPICSEENYANFIKRDKVFVELEDY